LLKTTWFKCLDSPVVSTNQILIEYVLQVVKKRNKKYIKSTSGKIGEKNNKKQWWKAVAFCAKWRPWQNLNVPPF